MQARAGLLELLDAARGLLVVEHERMAALLVVLDGEGVAGEEALPAFIIDMLRKQPQTFIEGGDGRWRLREQVGLLVPEEGVTLVENAANSYFCATRKPSG